MKKSIITLCCIVLISSCQEKVANKNEVTAILFDSIKLERYAVPKGNMDSISLSSYIMKYFDEKGTETKSIYYSSDNSIMMQFENEYENGNKTRVNWVNGKDEMVRYVKMTYNDKNRLIKSETFNTSDEFQTGFIHQWKDGGKTEEKGPIVEGEEFKPNAIYKYNDQQEFVSLVEFDENDSLYGTFQWKYTKFDKNNEWIKRQMIFDDTLVRIEKRLISYQK